MAKTLVEVFGQSPGLRTNYPWPGETVSLLSDRQLFLRTTDGLPFTDLPGPTQLSQLAGLARERFEDQIPLQTSLPNFGFELREALGMLPKLKRGLVFDGDVAEGNKSTGKNIQIDLEVGRQQAADSYLSYTFGSAPFIGDCIKLWNLLDTVNKRIEYLKSIYGKPTKLKAQFRDVGTLPAWRDWLPAAYLGPLGRYESYLRYDRTDVTFRATLVHRLEGLDTFGGKVRALLTATGFNNPLRALWNALPFSFFVDWFANIGSVLSRTRAQPFQGLWDLSEIHYTVDNTSDFIIRGFDLQSGSSQGEFGTMRITRKVRRLGHPEQFLSLDLMNLSPSQLLIYLALLSK